MRSTANAVVARAVVMFMNGIVLMLLIEQWNGETILNYSERKFYKIPIIFLYIKLCVLS